MLSNVVSTEERTVLFSEPKTDPRSHVRVSEIINALSYAMDLTEGLPAGHYLRVCWIGMQIGRRLNLDSEKLSNLYYTLLLKDVGYSSNNANVSEFYSDDEDLNGESHYQSFYSQSVWGLTRFITKNLASTVSVCKRNSKLVWLAIQGKCLEREVAQARCKRGAAIAARMGFPLEVADGIHYLDEHYNGQGNLERKRGANIPLQSRIALLSQVLEEFYTIYGPQEALNEVRRCRGTWFDPKLVDVLESIAADPGFWEPLSSPNIQDLVRDLEPEERVSQVNQDQIDQI